MDYQLAGIVEKNLRRWPLAEGTTQVGRSSELPIALRDPSVSRLHAEIRRQGDTLAVQDLHSRNGTSVNGVRIQERHPLQPGDRVSFGNVVLTLLSETQPIQPALSDHGRLDSTVKLEWNDVRALPPQEGEEASPLLRVITELGEFLVLHQPVEQICDTCLETMERLVPFQLACLLLLDERGEPVLKAVRNRTGRGDVDLAVSRTMIDAVIHERASLLVHDAMSDPRFEAAQSVILEQIRSALVVPLFDNKTVIGVLYSDTRQIASPYTKTHLRGLALFANIMAVKISNARLLEVQREKERLQHEIDMAARIQRTLLREELPCPAGYELHARVVPCTEVGGDLYDVLRLPGERYAIVLGDVVGHGVGAALLMANALAVFRALAGEFREPVELVQRIHTQIYASTDASSYLTLFLGILDPGTHSLEFVNAGQEPPALLAPGAAVQRLESTSPPVGLLERTVFVAGRVELPPAGLLCSWSDGIPEAHRPDVGEEPLFFGESESLLEILAAGATLPAAELADRVFARVDAFLDGAKAPDDRTLLLLRRLS